MNTRNVLLLILCTSVVSVTTALVTVRLVQNNTSVAPSTVATTSQESLAVPPQAPIQMAAGKIPPPPPPPHTVTPPQGLQQLQLPAPESIQSPQEQFDAVAKDTRKPLKPEEVKRTLLRKTPACDGDYDELCSKDTFLAEHPLACLRKNKQRLSTACSNQVAAVQENFLKACGDDINRLCPKMNRYFGCLKERMPLLSAECRKNVAEHSRQ